MSYIKTLSMAARDAELPAPSSCATLAHWFKCEEDGTGSTVSCAKTGITIPTLTQSRLGNGFGLAVTTAADVAPSASFTSPSATDDFMVVAGMNPVVAGQLTLGNAISTADNTIGIGAWTGVVVTTVNDGTNTYTVGAIADETNSVVLTADVDSATGLNLYQGSITPIATDSLTVPDYQGITLADKCSINVNELYGFAVFYFTGGLPGNALGAGLWMADQWRQGNKVLHPDCANWT